MDEEDDSLNCDYCKVAAPINLKFLKESWVCPICSEKPLEGYVPLKLHIENIYTHCRQMPMRLLYISDLSNNLSKIHKHFNECVDLDNPLVTITLTFSTAIDMLNGEYDVVYIDNDLLGKDSLINALEIKDNGSVKFVEPIKQGVIK